MGKSFKMGLDNLIKSTTIDEDPPERLERKKLGRPTTNTRVLTKTSQEGTREGETRATFIVKEDILEKLKAVAFWERKQIKALVQEALEAYINKRGEGKLKEAEKAYKERQQ